MVPLRTPTLPPATHTNCLLLGDDELWVVAPGSPWPEEQAILRQTLDKLAEEGRRAVGVLLTHHRHDHAGGARVLGLPIAATRETAAMLDFGVDRIAEDGARFDVGPRGWRALHLPGHTRGHLCLREEGSGAIVAGDLVAGVGTVVIDPPEGDMKDYLASLDRLLETKPGCIYPAHGPGRSTGWRKILRVPADGEHTPCSCRPDVAEELVVSGVIGERQRLVRPGDSVDGPAGEHADPVGAQLQPRQADGGRNDHHVSLVIEAHESLQLTPLRGVDLAGAKGGRVH